LLASLTVLIFVLNFLGNNFGWYSSVWYFDNIMHFLGGFWLAFMGIYIFKKDIPLNLVFKVLTLVFVVSVGWEIFEILVNEAIAQNPFDTINTVSDLIFDLAGGGAALFYYMKRIMLPAENNVQSN